MRNLIKLFAAIYILSLFGCINETEEGIKELIISDKVIDDHFSSIISSYEVIGIDDQVDAYFENPSRMILSNSYMIFSVPRPTPRILLFDSHGKYIRTIGRKGRGPGEFNSFDDFTYNETDQTITVYQRDRAIILDLNGNLIGEVLLDFKTVRNLKVGQGYMIEKRTASGDPLMDYQIRFVDKDYKTIDKRMPLKDVKSIGFSMQGQLNRTGVNQDYAYYFPVTGDTIFHLIGKSLKPVYRLTFDKETFIMLILEESTSALNTEYYIQLANKDIYRNLNYHEVSNLRLLHFTNNKKALCYVYDEHHDAGKLLEASYNLHGTHDNHGFIITKSLSVEKIINTNIDPDRSKCSNPDSLERIISRRIDDFPVIIKIKFKDEIL